MITLPRVVQRPSPNYTPSFIKHDLLVAHIMEGGYAGSVAWLCQRQSNASVHLCMNEDGSEVSQLVPLQFKAWGQCAFNGAGISLEIPGFTGQGIPEDRWRAAALIFGWLAVAYAIPVRWAQGGQGQGICQHHDLGAAGGGHVDCTAINSPDWQRFVSMVGFFHDEFAKAPLPPFALHGLPNPRQAELPPDVTPTPSHGGEARNEPGDVASHPTPSGHPHGSVADLQWRLNKAGAAPPLKVDGFAGRDTRVALLAFQYKHGLAADGIAGALTWAALDAAS